MNEANSKPQPDGQLQLFSEYYLGAEHVSRSVPKFDLLPFFLNSKRNEVDPNTRVADIQGRRHEYQDGNELIVFTTEPVMLESKKKGGRTKMYFAGDREHLVATAIRALAVRGAAKLGVDREKKDPGIVLVTVAFTARQLRAELQATKHTFSHSEVVEALEILARTNASVTRSREGQESTQESFTYYSAFLRQGDKYIVTLNRYESSLILSGAYRAIRYDRLMALDDPIARWIFQYMHSEFRNVPSPQSGKHLPFQITLESMFARGVLERTKETRKAVYRVRQALDLLVQHGHLAATPSQGIRAYEENLQTEATGGRRKIVGASWQLYPSDQNADEIIDAHSEAKYRKEELRYLPPEQRLMMTSEVRKRITQKPS